MKRDSYPTPEQWRWWASVLTEIVRAFWRRREIAGPAHYTVAPDVPDEDMAAALRGENVEARK